MFTLASNATEKKYIEEITCLLKLWIQDSLSKTVALNAIHLNFWIQDWPLKTIQLKIIHVMTALLLKKRSKA